MKPILRSERKLLGELHDSQCGYYSFSREYKRFIKKHISRNRRRGGKKILNSEMV